MSKNGALMVVSTRVNPGNEDAYDKWYDEHVTLLFTFKSMKRVSRNHCTRPLGPTGDSSPEYITIYELEDKADIEAFFQSYQMQEAKKQFDEGWTGLGDVLWSGWYEPVNTLERGPFTVKKRYMEIVGSGPEPGQDAAYLDYYVDHFTKMFEYSGIKKINYCRCFQLLAQNNKSPEYVTVYDFESKVAMETFYRSPIFTDAKKDWEEIGQPAMDLQWAACYESVITLER
jgi:uncharacterized protein (DUF1330 family)